MRRNQVDGSLLFFLFLFLIVRAARQTPSSQERFDCLRVSSNLPNKQLQGPVLRKQSLQPRREVLYIDSLMLARSTAQHFPDILSIVVPSSIVRIDPFVRIAEQFTVAVNTLHFLPKSQREPRSSGHKFCCTLQDRTQYVQAPCRQIDADATGP